jgi:hypothetical protein
MANNKTFTDASGDTLKIDVIGGYVWFMATAPDTGDQFYLQFEPDTAREMVEWLVKNLEGKIEISRRSELKKVEGGQNKLTHILYSDGSADCETEFISTKEQNEKSN